MVLKLKEYLNFNWDSSEFIMGKPVFINGKPDQDQPIPRGRDWRIKSFFNTDKFTLTRTIRNQNGRTKRTE